MKLKDRLQSGMSKVEGPAKDLLGKLSRSQRVSLAILAGAVVLIFVMVIVFTPTESDARGTLPDDDAGIMRQGLETKGIPFTEEGGLLVVARSDMDKARAVAIESGLYSTDKGYFKWLYDDTSWNETSGHRAEKILDTLRRRTEDAILEIDGVHAVTLNVQLQKGSVFVNGKRPSTASVKLDTGRKKIDLQRADGIRRFVAFSFGIKEEDVMVVDSLGPVDLEGAGGMGYLDDTKQAKEKALVGKLQSHLATFFTPRDFIVTADMRLNTERKETQARAIDLDKSGSLKARTVNTRQEATSGALAPGVKPNVVSGTADPSQVGTRTVSTHDEVDYDNEFGYSESRIQQGPGAVEKVALLVTVSRVAIEDIIRLNRGEPEYTPTQDDIDAEVERLEEFVRGATADTDEIEAKVYAVRFTADPAVATEDSLALSGFIELHGRELILAGLAIFGCFLLYRIAVRSVPEMEALPDPVSDLQRFLEEKEERDRRLAEELAAQKELEKETVNWEASDEDREALDLLKAVTDFASDRPELATTVVRNWLSELNPGQKKDGFKSESKEAPSEASKSGAPNGSR